MLPSLNFISSCSIDIFEQLKSEEALFRANNQNWCIVVHGTSPAIVMGAFGKKEDLIDFSCWQHYPIPLIQRFTGGGTVVVDQQTVFVAWILNALDIAIEPYPHSILSWVSARIFPAMHPLFPQAIDHDFCIQLNSRAYKFAGHAQAIANKRFVHHSSFLWDYQPSLMNILKHPKRQPSYRAQRLHHDFLYPLKSTSLTSAQFTNQLRSHLDSCFIVQDREYSELEAYLNLGHRKTNLLEYFETICLL